jgi:phosphopantothenoylcysteine decarboxylase/phosphopantothenate--cysteine ligase
MQVLLGIGGGIAAYKAPELVRALRRAGHGVRCVVTDNARRLVAPDALVAVSGAPVATTMWPGDGSMPHIELARWCDALVVAPATADLLARFALGLADDLLTTLYLALEPSKRLVLVPAMNTVMWDKPIVQTHVATLRGAGARIVPPIPGDLACGETGVGAQAAPEAIVAALAG